MTCPREGQADLVVCDPFTLRRLQGLLHVPLSSFMPGGSPGSIYTFRKEIITHMWFIWGSLSQIVGCACTTGGVGVSGCYGDGTSEPGEHDFLCTRIV